MNQLSEEQQGRQEAVCRVCEQKIYLAGDEWRHNFNESLWCRPTTATPLLDSDSQAADTYEINEVDAERLADYHKIGGMPAIVKSVDYGATTLAECVQMAIDRWYKRGRSDAATAMRDKCVEKVTAVGDEVLAEFAAEFKPDGSSFSVLKREAVIKLLRRLRPAIESLTLDQVKPGGM